MRSEKLIKKFLRELYKHAKRDDCYDCKQILREMGLDPTHNIDDLLGKEV